MPMTQSRHINRSQPRWFGSIVVLAMALITLSACGGKSPAQLATDALNAGIAAHTAGNIPEAKKQYQECLKQEPTHKICHYNLGLIAQESENDPAAAENEYRLSLSADPAYTPSLFNLAIVRTKLGDTTEAIELYRKYVQLKPDDAGGHLNLGLLLAQTGDTDEGQREIEAALAIDPTIAVPQASPSPNSSSAPNSSPTTKPS